MKFISIVLILGMTFLSCEKFEKKCWSCSRGFVRKVTGGITSVDSDYSKRTICDKSDKEIEKFIKQQSTDSSYFNSIGQQVIIDFQTNCKEQ